MPIFQYWKAGCIGLKRLMQSKIPLNIGDFIFAVSAYFSIFIILNVHRVALEVAIGLHFGVAVGLHRVAGVARFLG